MMNLVDYLLIGLFLGAVLPVFVQAICNTSAYRKCRDLKHSGRMVSVIIPARDEEENMEKVVSSILASEYSNIEVLVGNDHSEDNTEAIVRRLSEADSRVKLVQVDELPKEWGGKVHACWSSAKNASGSWLLFLDADVQLKPEAIGKMVGEAEAREVKFLSGFPNEVTGSFGERVLIPMIFFVLLGFLSIRRMRGSTNPVYAASCGQVMLIDSQHYWEFGGHQSIKNSFHDGLDMPRLFRSNGFLTDLVDLSDIVSCRMYYSSWDTCTGLEKNAKYGMGKPPLIFIFTFMLLFGQVLPWLLPLFLEMSALQIGLSFAMGSLGYLVRFIHCVNHGCSWMGALLHPLGVVAIMAIQWVSLMRGKCGFKSSWKGRAIG